MKSFVAANVSTVVRMLKTLADGSATVRAKAKLGQAQDNLLRSMAASCRNFPRAGNLERANGGVP
jgi:hypothetical protein